MFHFKFGLNRTAIVVGTVALASGSVTLVAGPASAMPRQRATTQSQAHTMSLRERTGIAPWFASMIRFGEQLPPPPKGARTPINLAVSDLGTGAVEVRNSSYLLEETISGGINEPDGDWYDSNDNLYVANVLGVNVQQYNASYSNVATYSANLIDPVDVTVDRRGNVYVADYGNFFPSVVVEYPQGSNTPIATCSTGLANEGVAVDKNGVVFVSGATMGIGKIVEYSSGLAGCPTPTTLGVTLGYAGGLRVDKHHNLAACDQTGHVVDIIQPPYTSIASTITGANDPFRIAFNAKQSLIYIADPADGDVHADKYPSGKNVTTLGSVNGLSDPEGIAAYE